MCFFAINDGDRGFFFCHASKYQLLVIVCGVLGAFQGVMV